MSASVLAPHTTPPMGISQVERVGGGPALDNAVLREILGRGGGGAGEQTSPRHFSPGADGDGDGPADLRRRSVADPPRDDADEEMASSRPTSPDEKRSRLESIVSSMQSSPQPVVNGCKKRKLYQPVQHEKPTSAGSDSEMEPEPELEHASESEPAMQRKLVTVRSQLSLMQERYNQLYKEQAEATRKRSASEAFSGSPTSSPEMSRPSQMPPTPTTRADHPPSSNFIDYARRVLNADLRSREQERLSQPPRPAPELGQRRVPAADVEGLADALKSELSSSLTGLIDSIVHKWSQQRRAQAKAAEAAAEQTSPRAEILRRISQHNGRFPGPFPSTELPFGLSISALRPPAAMPPLYPHKSFPGGLAATPAYGTYGLPAFCSPQPQEQESPLSLVVTPKRKRPHKLAEGRLEQLGGSDSPPSPPSSVAPVSRAAVAAGPLPTAVRALPEAAALFPVYPYGGVRGGSPRGRESASPPSMLHPALLAGRRSPGDALSYRATPDRSDCNSLEGGYDAHHGYVSKTDIRSGLSLTADFSSTLTPLHLRKAKLMFYWTRYPSSTVLKSYFPDINFNKNNTAQLVKWFSNFREFFYIQMEKHARQALGEGVKSADELHVSAGCELLRALNLHYNRNNHIEVPVNFPIVAEAALREFFRAIQEGKDAEPSWKKAIYKVISRLDESVPEYFRSPAFLEQLE